MSSRQTYKHISLPIPIYMYISYIYRIYIWHCTYPRQLTKIHFVCIGNSQQINSICAFSEQQKKEGSKKEREGEREEQR